MNSYYAWLNGLIRLMENDETSKTLRIIKCYSICCCLSDHFHFFNDNRYSLFICDKESYSRIYRRHALHILRIILETLNYEDKYDFTNHNNTLPYIILNKRCGVVLSYEQFSYSDIKMWDNITLIEEHKIYDKIMKYLYDQVPL